MATASAAAAAGRVNGSRPDHELELGPIVAGHVEVGHGGCAIQVLPTGLGQEIESDGFEKRERRVVVGPGCGADPHRPTLDRVGREPRY